MPRLSQGSILWHECLDEQGRNPKLRPVVVVSSEADIASHAVLHAVAVTHTIPSPLPEYCVPLPWSRPRHPRTGLSSASVVNCRWIVTIESHEGLEPSGSVPVDALLKILRALRET